MRNLLILLLLPFISFGQSKSLVLIIDTLEFQDYKVEFLRVNVRNNGPSSWEEEVDSTKMQYSSTFPNLTVSLDLKNDRSLIEIPLDKNGSYLKVFNAYSLKKDTLTINKLIIFTTAPADSTISIIAYTHKKRGELAECAYKVKIKKRGTPAELAPPNCIPITFNNIAYQTFLTTESVNTRVLHGHGSKPRNSTRKNGSEKAKVKVINIDERTFSYPWIGQIKLKNE